MFFILKGESRNPLLFRFAAEKVFGLFFDDFFTQRGALRKGHDTAKGHDKREREREREREAELEAHASHVLPTKESLQLTKLRARSPYLTYVYNTTNPRRAAPVGKNLEPGTQPIQFEKRKKEEKDVHCLEVDLSHKGTHHHL